MLTQLRAVLLGTAMAGVLIGSLLGPMPVSAQTKPATLGSGKFSVATATTAFRGPDNTTCSAPAHSFTAQTTTGLSRDGNASMLLCVAGAKQINLSGTNWRQGSDTVIGWTASAGDGTAAADAGISRISAGFLAVGNGTAGSLTGTIRATTFRIGAANSNAITTAGTGTVIKGGDGGNYFTVDTGVITIDSATMVIKNSGAGQMLWSTVGPNINSGFGTSPSITNNTGTVAFRLQVGTGGVATTGVVGLPAATTGWNCMVNDETTNVATRQTGNTTASVTVTGASAWAAADKLFFHCFAY